MKARCLRCASAAEARFTQSRPSPLHPRTNKSQSTVPCQPFSFHESLSPASVATAIGSESFSPWPTSPMQKRREFGLIPPRQSSPGTAPCEMPQSRHRPPLRPRCHRPCHRLKMPRLREACRGTDMLNLRAKSSRPHLLLFPWYPQFLRGSQTSLLSMACMECLPYNMSHLECGAARCRSTERLKTRHNQGATPQGYQVGPGQRKLNPATMAQTRVDLASTESGTRRGN